MKGAIMKFELGALLMFCSLTAAAEPYFFSNPYQPYPPGCITTPVLEQALEGDHIVEVWSSTFPLASASHPGVWGDVNLAVYRAGCAEPNRSVILLEFSLRTLGTFMLPDVLVHVGTMVYPMVLAKEPNSWGMSPSAVATERQAIGDFTGGQDDAFRFRWVYVLDVDPALALSTDAYNGTFKLQLDSDTYQTYRDYITIPPTTTVLGTRPRIELNGRLSGNWVVDGATDQGVMLSFSSIVGQQVAPIESPLTIFLSWYTFDAQGEMLWLTGAAEFQAGGDEVLIPLTLVSDGNFMSSKKAGREEFGTVRLMANSCNDISFDYNLPASSGLGSGTQTLRRLFALEIAGFACRDFETRLADNVPDSTQRMQ